MGAEAAAALGRLEAEASSVRPSAPPAGRASRRGRDIRGPPSRSTLRRPNSCSSMNRPQRARPLIDGARTSARRTACTQTQDPADSAAPRTPTRRARRTGGRAATRRARVPTHPPAFFHGRGTGVLALRCRTSRSPCRVEFNTRSTTLVTHDAGGRYNILFYSASVRCKSNSTARSINSTRRAG